MAKINSNSPYKGDGSLTREQFLFYEMRTTAKLMTEGFSDDEIFDRIIGENLFQYPTEKTIKSIARACISRLRGLESDTLVDAVANQPSEIAKQVCLYAIMKKYRLMWDFMLTVIGEKYRQQDMSFGNTDINVFFMRLQEQDDLVASWSDATIKRIGSLLKNILVQTEYLDDRNSKKLNPVWLSPLLENEIREKNDNLALAAFNNFA